MYAVLTPLERKAQIYWNELQINNNNIKFIHSHVYKILKYTYKKKHVYILVCAVVLLDILTKKNRR